MSKWFGVIIGAVVGYPIFTFFRKLNKMLDQIAPKADKTLDLAMQDMESVNELVKKLQTVIDKATHTCDLIKFKPVRNGVKHMFTFPCFQPTKQQQSKTLAIVLTSQDDE